MAVEKLKEHIILQTIGATIGANKNQLDKKTDMC